MRGCSCQRRFQIPGFDRSPARVRSGRPWSSARRGLRRRSGRVTAPSTRSYATCPQPRWQVSRQRGPCLFVPLHDLPTTALAGLKRKGTPTGTLNTALHDLPTTALAGLERSGRELAPTPGTHQTCPQPRWQVSCGERTFMAMWPYPRTTQHHFPPMWPYLHATQQHFPPNVALPPRDPATLPGKVALPPRDPATLPGNVALRPRCAAAGWLATALPVLDLRTFVRAGLVGPETCGPHRRLDQWRR